MPIYLGLCRGGGPDEGHKVLTAIVDADLGRAVAVSSVHSAAMIVTGGCLAWLTYRYLGVKFVSRSWLNLEEPWAVSLILVGLVSFAFGFADSPF